MIRYTKIDINYAAGGNLRRLSAEEVWETIEDCAKCDKQRKNLTSTIFDQTIANLKAQLVKNEVVRVIIPKCMSWLDAYNKPISNIEDRVENPSPQSTPQVLLLFEVYTPPVTYPEEVDETIGIPMEVIRTWMAFRGNTRDLDSFEEETNKITDLQQIHKEVLFTVRGDGIACIKRCHRDLSSNGNKKRSSGRESGSGPTYRGSRIMQVATACRDFNTTPSLDLWSPFLDRSRCIALCIALPSSTPL
ncbi:hypothetical protein Tco_0122043 [Tanacetum coccineum]